MLGTSRGWSEAWLADAGWGLVQDARWEMLLIHVIGIA